MGDTFMENIAKLAQEEKDAELEFLKWFYSEADFGPAHSDVMDEIHQLYVNQTGNPVPDRYRREE